MDNYKEHEFHTCYDPHCSTCYSESEVKRGLEGDFSFEKVLEMVGHINKIYYNINPFKKDAI